jgi:hypothetical protein
MGQFTQALIHSEESGSDVPNQDGKSRHGRHLKGWCFEAVIQLADFVDEPGEPDRLNGRINYFWKSFYYKHVETFLKKGEHIY